ncbi:hypothetical protein CSKR_103493 [Clonorchis sinensis]|uniref:Uncharacterized protein n=1 Tax=Clonorchis sinensis TaxID=79923 RepID=A0A419PIU0_CLOSI|nr:hypothetical protein CSKR_103493 [Clonorchis sinensis]
MAVPPNNFTDILRFLDSPVEVAKVDVIIQAMCISVAAGSGLDEDIDTNIVLNFEEEEKMQVCLDELTKVIPPFCMHSASTKSNGPSGREGAVKSRKGLVADLPANRGWQCRTITALTYIAFLTAPGGEYTKAPWRNVTGRLSLQDAPVYHTRFSSLVHATRSVG